MWLINDPLPRIARDAETVRGKGYDALNAVPNLMDRYHQARYLVDHQEEIRAGLDYAHEHAPDPQELDTAIQKSSETLERIRTTYSEVTQARETFTSIRPTNLLETVPRVKGTSRRHGRRSLPSSRSSTSRTRRTRSGRSCSS